MKLFRSTAFLIPFMILSGSAVGAFCADNDPSGAALPKGLEIKDTYQQGTGAPVGKVRQTRGKAVIMHADKKFGYAAASGLLLYKNDTIVTRKSGHLSFELNDSSFIVLSPDSHIEINKSLYDPERKRRSSFLNMVFGKVRFVVRKLMGAKHSEFKVKTQTAIAGVRGSDFIIVADAEMTEINTLSDTVLEVVGLSALEAPPLVLTSYERTRVLKGRLPAEAKPLETEEVDRLLKEFRLKPPAGEPLDKSGKGSGKRPLTQTGETEGIAIPEDALEWPDYDLFQHAPAPTDHLRGDDGRAALEEIIFIQEIRKDTIEKKTEADLRKNFRLPDSNNTNDQQFQSDQQFSK